ncbi:hypothetical protein CR513_33428, partial [Mucuna pruriens]
MKYIEVDCHSIREAYDRRFINLPRILAIACFGRQLWKEGIRKSHIACLNSWGTAYILTKLASDDSALVYAPEMAHQMLCVECVLYFTSPSIVRALHFGSGINDVARSNTKIGSSTLSLSFKACMYFVCVITNGNYVCDSR